MHYLIKQEKCGCDADQMRENWDGAAYPCVQCTNGYIETRVSADEWLESKLAALGLVQFQTYCEHGCRDGSRCSVCLGVPQLSDNSAVVSNVRPKGEA